MNEKRDFNTFLYLINSNPQKPMRPTVRQLFAELFEEAINKVLSSEEIDQLFEIHKNPDVLWLAEKIPLLLEAFNNAFTKRRYRGIQREEAKILNLENYKRSTLQDGD